MNKLFKSYPIRHALSLGLAILTAVIINYFFSYSKQGWIILTTYLVSQTTRGTPLKQSFSYFFIIVIIAMILPAYHGHIVQDRVIDCLIGGILGILFGQFVFPVKIYTEFSLGVVPILKALQNYAQTYSHCLQHASYKNLLIEKKWEIESALAARQGVYPEWVYEVGFNPGLRAGFRFFLIQIERISEIFFSMNYIVDSGIDTSLLSELATYIVNVNKKNEELLQVLIDYFSENKFKNPASDENYTSDMVELEKALNRLIPVSLDLLDMSSDYLVLTTLVRDVKDMRELLLELVMALPQAATS